MPPQQQPDTETATRLDEAVSRLHEDGTITAKTEWEPSPMTLESLPRIEIQPEQGRERPHEIPPQLRLNYTLGEGGMGIVRTATQLPLRREVAVKLARPGSSTARTALLREALVTGRLQHPGIVPVYLLGRSDTDEPMFVMKRIEGDTWSDTIHQPQQHSDLMRDAGTALDFHLTILAQVCNAVHFAHCQGVLHRDIKPSNVMLGQHGEVYVLDWGLAAACGAGAPESLPRARDIDVIEGTPHYMAPEMLEPQVVRISQATDVFLLGATLFEIATGEAPFARPTPYASLAAAALNEPRTYPDSVDAELIDIIEKAMNERPEERYASAAEMRASILAYQRGQGDRRLLSAAAKKLAQLTAAAHSESSDAGDLVHTLFLETRFAFQQALENTAHADRATTGLRMAIETVIRFELRRSNIPAARALLAQLDTPSQALVDEVIEAERQQERDLVRLAQLEQVHAERDPAVSRPGWIAMSIPMAFVASSAFGTLAVLHHTGTWTPTAVHMLIVALVLAVTTQVIVAVTSHRFPSNRHGKAMLSTLVLATYAAALASAMGVATQQPVAHVCAAILLVLGTATLVISRMEDARLGPSGMLLWLGSAVTIAFPDHMFEIQGASGAVLALSARHFWKKDRTENGADTTLG